MRVVHLTNNDFDGAGRAVLRLHRGLKDKGIDSTVVVLYKRTLDKSVHAVGYGRTLRDRLNYLKLEFKKANVDVYEILILSFQALHKIWRYRLNVIWQTRTLFNFSIPIIPYKKLKPYIDTADVVCLHGVHDIMSPKYISRIHQELDTPIIFFPRDMEPMTGGCHFNFSCEKYMKSCGGCPQIGKVNDNDISKIILEAKKHYLNNIPIHIVASNSFVLDRLNKSSLFAGNKKSVIYMGIEPERYADIDKSEARRKIQIDLDEKIILFGCFNASDKRKGAYLLKEALQERFTQDKNDNNIETTIRLITFGDMNGFSFDGLSIKWTHLGHIDNVTKMNFLYRSADVLVSPSTDDLGPTIVQEAFMNKLPIVSFELGLAVDLVKNGINGYSIPCFDVKKYGEAIYSIISLESNKQLFDDTALASLREQCTLSYEANAYANLIENVYQSK